jgi:hypothetical protein
MDWKFPIDSYEMKARYAPAFLLSLPVIISLWSCYGVEYTAFSKLTEGILSIIIIYVLSVIVRSLGKRAEPKLWASWGGAPSTMLLSWRDTTLGDNLKDLYLQRVKDKLNLPVPTKEEERADPARANKLVDQAFQRIKGVIRQNDKDGLWSIANADYGFARNLYGSRALWLIVSCLSAIISGYNLYSNFNRMILIGSIINISLLFACVYFGWFILPEYTKQVAFRYAEHSWESFYNNVSSDTLRISH